MTLDLTQLNRLLDEHFRLAPPLDSQIAPAFREISEFGSGISLGDGTSMAGVRGLENIQVTEKVNRFDKVRQISMKDWLQKTIMENPNPEAVAASVQKLLKNGNVSYFEQGREFATRLSMNTKTSEFTQTPVNRKAPLVKPTLTFMQKFQRLVGWLPEDELKAYNRDLLSYELQQKALDTSKARVPVGAGIVLENDDGKGRVLVDGVDMTKTLGNIELRREISQLTPEMRRTVDLGILAGESSREAIELKINPILNEKKTFNKLYPNGAPAGISTLKDHIDAKVAKQDSFENFSMLKKSRALGAIASRGGAPGQGLIGDCLLEVMNGKGKANAPEELLSLMKNDACKALFDKQDVLLYQINSNKLFDQFAKNLVKHPINGITPKQIENLLDVCIEQHPQLRSAIEAAKNPDMLKSANNKQPQKQMGKEAPKIKPIAPKMG